MLKVAMLSKWHVHATDYAAQLLESGKVEIAAVWDEDPVRGAAWAKELGAEFIPELDAVLARKDIPAVICDTPTTMHKQVLIAAAQAGKHIFTEKMLATTEAEALEIADAVKKAGVTFVISYPLRREPLMCYAKALADEGIFGKIGMVRMRRSHGGITGKWLPDYWYDTDSTGGGAMMDLGAHPMYMLSWFGGAPKRVSGMFNNLFGTSSDENAAALIEFENGTIGIGETSFIAHNTPDVLEIYGTEATLLIWDKQIKLSVGGKDYEAPALPAEAPEMPIFSFIKAVTGEAPAPAELDVDAGVAVSKLMEMAYLSNEQGKTMYTL